MCFTVSIVPKGLGAYCKADGVRNNQIQQGGFRKYMHSGFFYNT